MRTNIVDIDFDPYSLKPAGPPVRQNYGPDRGVDTQEYYIQTPMVTPDGKRVIRTQIEGSDGTVRNGGYHYKDANGQIRSIQNDATVIRDGDGGFRQIGPDRWTEADFEKTPGFKKVFGDKKLMAFLAIAGGVSALASSGAVATTGGAGGAGLGGGTGATPGIVAGGTSGTEGLIAGAAQTGAGTAASAAGSTTVDTAASQAINPVGGDAAASFSDAAIGDYAAGGSGAFGTGTSGVSGASTWWEQFSKTGVGEFLTSPLGQRLGGAVVSGIGSAILEERRRDQAIEDRDNERAYQTRNLQAEDMPKIDWSVVRVERQPFRPPP